MTASTSTNDWAMLDTNILVYAYDPTASQKHAIALDLLRRLGPRLVLSAQILNEFYVVATRAQRSPGLSHAVAAQIVADFAAAAQILPLTQHTTLRAVRAVSQYGLSFWDALVWAAASEYGVPVIYTEDFQHGRMIEGVTFTNPFVAAPT